MSTYRPSWGLDDGDTGELPAVGGNGEAASNGAEAETEERLAREATPDDVATSDDGWADPDTPAYADVHEWVTEWALPTLGRSTLAGGQRWCHRWDAHPEAVLRLTLAWRTWERARHDPTAYTTWLLDAWDRMWAALTAADGPFASCTPQRHDDGLGG